MRTVLDLRFVERDGKKILQMQTAFIMNQAVSYCQEGRKETSKGANWQDVPLFVETEATYENTHQGY